ncbi:MAG: hypothetical protein EXX96DRAFT_513798 [Benjaminiella poitrasii]|nr:MAG: hypothetical protein EXX96DRAFT_513798 [Benjaminiella poitrasii]
MNSDDESRILPLLITAEHSQSQETQQLVNKLPTPITPIDKTAQDLDSLINKISINDTIFSKTSQNQTNNLIDYGRTHSLKTHKSTYYASKSFQCSECQKQFLRLYDLKRHQKLHTGEKPYSCSVCHRSFSRLDALKRHKKAEEGRSTCIRSYQMHSSSKMVIRLSSTLPLLPDSSPLSSSLISNSTNETSFITSEWQANMDVKKEANLLNSVAPTLNSASEKVRLPSVLPLEQCRSDQQTNELKALRQRIHDLEIENRVLRSLFYKENN